MFCISGFILFDVFGEKPCAEDHESTVVDKCSLPGNYIWPHSLPGN